MVSECVDHPVLDGTANENRIKKLSKNVKDRSQ